MEPVVKTLRVRNYIQSKAFLMGLLQVVFGSVFLALISLVKVPLYPTPITLQTLGVFILGLALGPKKGALAVISYLLEASCGWPVLSGGMSNPLWMVGANGGFLCSFVPAAFIIGVIAQRFSKQTFLTALIAVFCGQLCIYAIGVSWLACFFGFQKAFVVGVVPFLSGMVIKMLFASSVYPSIKWVKNQSLFK